MFRQSRCLILLFKPIKIILHIKGIVCFILAALSIAVGPALSQESSSPVIITDRAGRQIMVKQPFVRIISLYGAHTENLYHLGLESLVIGVGINDTTLDQARVKPRFSYHDDPEKFLAYQPDLVLIRPMIDNGYPGLIHFLETHEIVVVSLQPSGIEQMYEYWYALGLLTGKTARADGMIRDFKQKIERIKAVTKHIHPRKKVYFEAIHTRMKTFTRGAMPIFALETAGGINIAQDAKASRNTNIAVYGKEQILAKATQIDVFLAQKGVMNTVTIEQIKQEPGFQIIKAIKHNQIYLIDEHIISRPVPELYQGIVSIGKVLYPDIFTKDLLRED